MVNFFFLFQDFCLTNLKNFYSLPGSKLLSSSMPKNKNKNEKSIWRALISTNSSMYHSLRGTHKISDWHKSIKCLRSRQRSDTNVKSKNWIETIIVGPNFFMRLRWFFNNINEASLWSWWLLSEIRLWVAGGRFKSKSQSYNNGMVIRHISMPYIYILMCVEVIGRRAIQ